MLRRFDGADLKAYSSRDPKDNTQGLGDPEARVGVGPEGYYLGYRSLFLIDMEGLPLGHVEAPANVNEKELVEPVLETDSATAPSAQASRLLGEPNR